VWDLIAADDPATAARMDELFSDVAARLATFPKMGTEGRVPGTRELLAHRSYMLVYEIIDDVAWILSLVHTSRQWPPDRTN
jgi:toxin ParE1/3/4